MSSAVQSDKLVVPSEIYRLLDPLERVALHQMEKEGRAVIVQEAGGQ